MHMKLVMLFGDSAVGKMTVGQELAKKTGLRLFYNHMTIEPIFDVFGYFNSKALARIREVIFEEFSDTELEGMIFTFMWDFDQREDWDYVQHISDIFTSKGADVYYVELDAPLEVRLERNETENRLKYKPSKRNLKQSRARLLGEYERYRCVSNEGEIPYENFLRILNADLPASAAADRIIERFNFKVLSAD